MTPAGETAHGADPTGLVERAKRGDRAAFDALHRRYAAFVHGVLVAHAPARIADDLAQDVFLAAWRGLGALKEDAHVGAWLATIARNRAARERTRRTPAEPLPVELPDPGSRRAEIDGDAVLDALHSLPDAYRETLSLRLVEGLTGPQIADATGLTHGSVRVNLTRGFALLRDELHRRGLP